MWFRKAPYDFSSLITSDTYSNPKKVLQFFFTPVLTF